MYPTVLVIDDEPAIRQALTLLLRRRGYRPLAVSSGEEGIETAARVLPDLILLNVQLPGVNGWEVRETLAASAETAAIPIIAITGFPAAISRLRALEAGFAGFVEKPFRHAALVKTMEDVLSDGFPAHHD